MRPKLQENCAVYAAHTEEMFDARMKLQASHLRSDTAKIDCDVDHF
jgi:hypothetical protein